MHLNKMVSGQKANLTLRWQETTLEFSATTVGMTDSGPLIKPFRPSVTKGIPSGWPM